MHGDANRRILNRAATTEFGNGRGSEQASYGPLRAHQSSGFLGIPESPGGFNNSSNLRAAKSFADLRSYTPSPAQSTASFPVALQSNIARFQDAGLGGGAGATPTMSSNMSGPLGQHSSESLLVNGLGNMTIGTSIGTGGSPRRLRPVFSFEDNQSTSTGPIGSNRNVNMNTYEDATNRDRNGINPSRQPRGPASERSQNFARGRQNGHQTQGSGELRHQASRGQEITVE